MGSVLSLWSDLYVFLFHFIVIFTYRDPESLQRLHFFADCQCIDLPGPKRKQDWVQVPLPLRSIPRSDSEARNAFLKNKLERVFTCFTFTGTNMASSQRKAPGTRTLGPLDGSKMQHAWKMGEGRAERTETEVYKRGRKRMMDGLLGGVQNFLRQLKSPDEAWAAAFAGPHKSDGDLAAFDAWYESGQHGDQHVLVAGKLWLCDASNLNTSFNVVSFSIAKNNMYRVCALPSMFGRHVLLCL